MEDASASPFLPRAAARALAAALRVMPVVVVLGARQTGKTTLVRSHPPLRARPYLTLDDLSVRLQAEADPEALVARAPELVLDEVQRAKDVLLAVKRAVDRDRPRRPGRFVLTGSANLLMLRRIGETLAGRAAYVTLWPLTVGELAGAGRTGLWGDLISTRALGWRDLIAESPSASVDWRAAVRRGGFPVPAHELAHPEERALWFSGYIQTYLERDLPELRAVENLAGFRRLAQAACLRTGALLNQSELGRDAGLSQPQVHRFLGVLEASYLAVRLPAFAVNRTKRLIKAPKLYWCDTALALHLAGEAEPRGAHLENLVLLDLLAWRELQTPRPEILYWRTADGAEVDFVVEAGRRLLPVEVKTAARIVPQDAKGLEAFLDEYPDRAAGGLLLYAGEDTFPLTRRVLAAPWWKVLAPGAARAK
ncbi:MAG: ATP-binding protein [Burkholderiales bacterium]|nr:ATP-binding protein [Burkholderiales bacterium]